MIKHDQGDVEIEKHSSSKGPHHWIDFADWKHSNEENKPDWIQCGDIYIFNGFIWHPYWENANSTDTEFFVDTFWTMTKFKCKVNMTYYCLKNLL